MSDIMKFKELGSNLEKLERSNKERNFHGLYKDLAQPLLDDFEKAEEEYYMLNHRLCVLDDCLSSRIQLLKSQNLEDDKAKKDENKSFLKQTTI